MCGIKRAYGEETTMYKLLYQGEKYGIQGSQYDVLPKNDTFSFTRENLKFDDSHNITISRECTTVYEMDGKVAVMVEGGRTGKNGEI